mmetsp:Transcript_21324/g.32007  ORF Transcript_21324/g.32007 Transcript_21324/m.32007 type:complete len:331 (-) Transcript_21324:170-1162(-)|eukprot:CAMPEP_0203668260 /NCGR_PEP_ID=MMETSP0090-20130426/4942_1 /ASSEMBLY_ACC=CAM_ASM_001088 /TAXON_ID=426623 /ORGANISM="Chaetoceros affinis, Strain CCMP159" /LENGTH=330 /DNA_ID=CAMNT_0050532655 /DNA_START=134 /DNA_END=1126 /DNA_ORIENTATION=-
MKTGIIGATLLITATTIDDTVWLVPYTTSSHLPFHTKLLHSLSFILTLECLSLVCVLVDTLLERGLLAYFNGSGSSGNSTIGGGADATVEIESMNAEEEKISFMMQCIGVVLCWSIAIYLLVKKILKKRRRARQREREQEGQQQGGGEGEDLALTQTQEQQQLLIQNQHSQHTEATLGQNAVHSLVLSMDTTMSSYQSNGATDSYQNKQDQEDQDGEGQNNSGHDNGGDDDDSDNKEMNTIPTTPSIGMIISLTTLGALDEISYFPALIMGKIFSPMELCIGALLASVIILCVIVFFLGQCKPLVDFLDSIPLYGIVGMFAVVLTIGLFF